MVVLPNPLPVSLRWVAHPDAADFAGIAAVDTSFLASVPAVSRLPLPRRRLETPAFAFVTHPLHLNRDTVYRVRVRMEAVTERAASTSASWVRAWILS